MPRFLVYTETYPSRSGASPRQTGIGRYCSDLADGLGQLGHPVSVFTASDGSDDGPRASSDAAVERVGAEPRWPHEVLHRAAMLRQRLASFQPDYLLVGDPVAHQVTALARPGRKVRYCPMFYGTELLAYRKRIAYRGWDPARNLRRGLLLSYLRRAHQPICISRYTSRCYSALGLPPREECIVFPAVSEPFLTQPVGGVATHDPRRQPPSGDVVRFITVARISERKNQRQVLEALAILRRTAGVRFQYVIVGNVDGEEHNAYLDSLLRFTRDNHLEDAVLFVRGATDDEKIAWIDASDVFVMLSRNVGQSVEGFGISVIEASCRGKPVVVSDQGGMPETIIDGQTGFSVPLDSLDAIAAPLLELARHPDRRSELGANGSRFVRDNFTPRRMAQRLTEHLSTARPAIAASAAHYTPFGTTAPVES
jgi:glycosyltransferase involved in cell wall biosynthesis